ncbi:hypothetical protein Bhyg_12736 [Pseudolycoriella hygida]|uniref:Uncharacterized protein n=1 Tax=Pseudolycoriella hygida TaxID=35572 RepID=A0A9Q0S1G2_9DIPT|nr:hypothetical protein Bhyg_12736 [Pseudolycoriella hygida]
MDLDISEEILYFTQLLAVAARKYTTKAYNAAHRWIQITPAHTENLRNFWQFRKGLQVLQSGSGFNPYANKHQIFLQRQIAHVKNVFKYFFVVANITIFFMLAPPILQTDTYDVQNNSNQSLGDSIHERKLPFDWSNKQFDVTVSPTY